MLVRFLALLEKEEMKNLANKPNKPTKQNATENVHYNVNKYRPEIRDDLDSREGEEQQFKGNDITHNRKSHHSKKRTSK